MTPRPQHETPASDLPAGASAAFGWKTAEIVGNRGLSLLRTLVLARILAPEEFGFVAIGLVSVESLLALSDFGMRQALVQAKQVSRRQVDAAWTFDVCRALLVAAVIATFAPWIARVFFNEPGATNMIRVLALAPIFDLAINIRLAELMRQLDFRPVAINGIVGSLVIAVVAVTTAPSLGAWGLCVGILAGGVTQLVLSYALAPRRPRLVFDFEGIRPFFQFGRWIFARQSIRVIGNAALQAMISHRLGTEGLGLYFLASRLAFLPRELVDKTVNQVTFPLHARLQAEHDRAARVFRAGARSLTAIVVPSYALAVVLAASAVEHLLGPQWQGASNLLRLLAIAALVGSFADSTIPALQGRGRTALIASLFASRSVLLLFLTALWTTSLGADGAGLAWIAAESLGAILGAVFVERLLPRPFEGLARSLAFATIVSLLGCMATQLTDAFVAGPLGVVAAGLVGGATIAFLLLRFDEVSGAKLGASLATFYPRFKSRIDRRVAPRGAK